MSEAKPPVVLDEGVHDYRGILCPMNFVHVKIELEKIAAGSELKVCIDSGEPMKNVPRSVQREGHQIVDEFGNSDGSFVLVIRKKVP